MICLFINKDDNTDSLYSHDYVSDYDPIINELDESSTSRDPSILDALEHKSVRNLSLSSHEKSIYTSY